MLMYGRILVRPDVTAFFLQTLDPTWAAWVSLLRATKLPAGEPLSSVDLTSAVNAINLVIKGKLRPALPPRFGFVQLVNFLESLEDRVRRDKSQGLLAPVIGRRDSSYAFDYYLKNATSTSLTRSYLSHLKRIGLRFKGFSGSSPLLLVVCSETADYIAYCSLLAEQLYRG